MKAKKKQKQTGKKVLLKFDLRMEEAGWICVPGLPVALIEKTAGAFAAKNPDDMKVSIDGAPTATGCVPIGNDGKPDMRTASASASGAVGPLREAGEPARAGASRGPNCDDYTDPCVLGQKLRVTARPFKKKREERKVVKRLKKGKTIKVKQQVISIDQAGNVKDKFLKAKLKRKGKDKGKG